MELAPIAMFVYNRLDMVKKTLCSLKKNIYAEDSILHIFADGAKPNISNSELEKVKKVRDFIKSEQWCKEVIIVESKVNLGLANSIIKGVTDVVNKHGKVIVLEDDLLLSPNFLSFMNSALSLYENESKVGSISGYVYPVKEKFPDLFFATLPECLGWATWKRAWNVFETDIYKCIAFFDSEDKIRRFEYNYSYGAYDFLFAQKSKKVDSWYIRWAASLFHHNMLTLYPGNNLVSHIGYEAGTHKYPSFLKSEPISSDVSEVCLIPIEISNEGERLIENYYNDYKMKLKKYYNNPFTLHKAVIRKWIGLLLPHGLYLYLKKKTF